jgi:putative endonuclease
MSWVYILASGKHGTLYIGVTNDLIRRVYQHKLIKGFTTQYKVDRLVWYEACDDPTSAITREKELKKWRRDWKINLIEQIIRIGMISMIRSLDSLMVTDSWLTCRRIALCADPLARASE